MNSFCKFIWNVDLIFGNLFFHNQISIRRFASWSWIIVGTKCSYIWCFKNKEIECFVVKYLKVDQTMLSNKICNMQTHPFKEHVEKKSTNLPILVSKITNENTKNCCL
jgi:hypothetical protein